MTDRVPRVSVFMASYNGAAYVEDAVQSVLAQTLSDLELVIVDDGSGAPTLDILRRLAREDTRIRLVESAHNGQIGTLNQALALCRGTLIARLDHDDVCLPDRLARQVSYLEAHPGVAAVGGEMAFMDGVGRAIEQKRRDPLKRVRHAPLAFPPKQVFVSGSTLMARKTAWDATGGFRPEFKAAEDRDICWLLARQGRVVRLPDIVVRYRMHDTNLSVMVRRTQLFSQFLASLAAVAAELGIDDTVVRSGIVVGGDYAPSVAGYRALLAERYPVETYWLFFLARMRAWVLGGYADGAALAAAIQAHWRARPWDRARLVTWLAALRYTQRKAALTVAEDA